MNIKFKWIGGATWKLDIDGFTIACDPVLCPRGTKHNYGPSASSIRLEDPVYTENDFKNIDLWLITHGHEDHLDLPGLKVINPETEIVTHQNAEKTLNRISPTNMTRLSWGQTKEIEAGPLKITVEAIPAVHGLWFMAAAIAGGVNGYWLTIRQGEEQVQLYVTSDTVTNKKVMQTLKSRKPDIMIPNMGAAFGNHPLLRAMTLNAKMLLEMKELMQPGLILPVHFGTFKHYVEPISKTLELIKDGIRIFKTGEEDAIQVP